MNDDNVIDATDLAIAIEKLLDECRSHMGYIERALDTAAQYAKSLHHKQIPLERYHEGWSYIGSADGAMNSFDVATETALNLRRAGDTALNDHYG